MQQSVQTPEVIRQGRDRRLEYIYHLAEQLKQMRRNEKELDRLIKNEIEIAKIEGLTTQGQYKLTQKSTSKTEINKDLLFVQYPEKFVEIAKIEVGAAKAVLTEDEYATIATISEISRDVVVKEEPEEDESDQE